MFSVGQGLLLSFLRRKGRGGRRRAPGAAACTTHPEPPCPMPLGLCRLDGPRPPGETPCAQGRIKQSAPGRGNSASCTTSSQKSGHRTEQGEGLWGARDGQCVLQGRRPKKSGPHLFSVEKTGQLQIFLSNKMPRIISGNIHRIVHPFHSGMFIYTGALRSAKETERYIGGTKI